MTVTVADVELFLGREPTEAEAGRIVQLIPFAEGQVEARFRGLSIGEGSETATVHPHDDVLWTPRYPVADVTTVEVDGNEITGLQWDQWGRIWPATGVVNEWELNLPLSRWTSVGITYDFGLDPTPPVLVQTVATMVANVIRSAAVNPDSVQSESLGAYQVSYGDFAVRQAMLGMTIPDIPGLDYWDRRRRIMSVALR